MGRTVPTFRMALENEILLWCKGYKNALRNEDKKIFGKIMNYSRLHGDAGMMSNRPVIFEVMMMNIILEQQKQLKEVQDQLIELQKKLDESE
ncbi:MAG: hypothetical protein GF329_17100 [Candidatus Lokiarchaeota archaeon]|nr:hypothetical protein [Candidatus Lokiarchaeota archaeon]